MPTSTLPTAQYTEENYSELYNNLPAGLKDLVLSGRLAILVSGVGVKNGLDADQVAELEPAVEDVCLGLITQKELPQNIATQVGIDISLARKVAGDCILEILEPFSTDINFARQFKLEMDEKLSNEKFNSTTNDLPDAKSLREQILRENKSRVGSDVKMAQFFNKKNDDVQVEEENYDIETETEEDQIENIPQNTFKASNFIAKKDEVDVNSTDEYLKNRFTKNNDMTFSNLMSKPNLTTANTATDGDTSATMIRFEQELATLTQAINTLVRTSPTSKDFNLKSFEEINSQIKKLEESVKKIEDQQQDLISKFKKIETTGLINNSDKSPEIKTIPTTGTKEEEKPIIFNSTVSKKAMENIANSETPKNSFNFDNLINKSSQSSENPTSSSFSWGKKDLNFNESIEKAEETKAKEEADADKAFQVTTDEKKKVLSSVLLKDLEKLKSINSEPENNSETQTTNTVKNTEPQTLKDELLPQNREERMKVLQEKIRNLNQGK
jgi:hypothetical protein